MSYGLWYLNLSTLKQVRLKHENGRKNEAKIGSLPRLTILQLPTWTNTILGTCKCSHGQSRRLFHRNEMLSTFDDKSNLIVLNSTWKSIYHIFNIILFRFAAYYGYVITHFQQMRHYAHSCVFNDQKSWKKSSNKNWTFVSSQRLLWIDQTNA